jgi:hypothetical protein
MKKTVVHILSTPYAGSHYLSLLLGSNSRAMHLGEVFHLEKGVRDKAGLTYHSSEVLEGIGPENIDQIYRIIGERVGPDIEVLVDNSKKISWSERFVGQSDNPQRYIHLIRDPRALVRRYELRSRFRKVLRYRFKIFRRLPALRGSIFFVPESMVWAYVWLLQNEEISAFFRRSRANWELVTYRDLACQAGVEIERLMRWLGLRFEPGQLEYWNFDHIGTQKTNYEWVKQQKTNYFDLRWQQDLPLPIQQRIAADPPIQRYLQSLGLRMVDNGLTRSANEAAPASAETAAASVSATPATTR